MPSDNHSGRKEAKKGRGKRKRRKKKSEAFPGRRLREREKGDRMEEKIRLQELRRVKKKGWGKEEEK